MLRSLPADCVSCTITTSPEAADRSSPVTGAWAAGTPGSSASISRENRATSRGELLLLRPLLVLLLRDLSEEEDDDDDDDDEFRLRFVLLGGGGGGVLRGLSGGCGSTLDSGRLSNTNPLFVWFLCGLSVSISLSPPLLPVPLPEDGKVC